MSRRCGAAGLRRTPRPFSTCGHPEAYPDGLKNFLLRVYSYAAGLSKEIDFSTFQDGHNELAICDAVLASAANAKWEPVRY